MDEYVILRAPGIGRPDFGTPMPMPSAGTRGGRADAEVRVEVELLDHADVSDVLRDPAVQAVAPSMPMKLHEPEPSDAQPSSESETWGVRAVGAHLSGFTGDGIVVAVLDTGIDADHEAFGKVNIIQRDFTDSGDGDRHGHGTHCAGTIFGGTVNGTRIGVAPGVKRALVGKVLGGNGGDSGTIIKAMQWALDEGANIISMSLGIDFPGYVEHLIKQGAPADFATSRALEGYRANLNLFGSFARYAGFRGSFGSPAITLAASGNESRRQDDPTFEIAVAPPAAAEDIIAVGALGEGPNGLVIAPFSNSNADIGAPGVNIISARAGGGLTALNGTSMATPHAAGVAALWAEQMLQTSGSFSTTTMLSRLVGSGSFDDVHKSVTPAQIGSGLIQAPV